jgi:hypothetical protein
VWTSGLENIFLFLAAKSKNKNFLCESIIKLPASYISEKGCMVLDIAINFDLNTTQYQLAKCFGTF